MAQTRDPFGGAILGTAVGDALGLPAEGLGRSTIRARWPVRWRHRLFFGRGLISDDTEHTALVAASLIENPRDVHGFERALAERFRWWLAGAPAGVGWATARAILRLWMGVSPAKSGVASAGNGPAMRSAIIGVFFAHSAVDREAYVRSSTRMTHTDPRALAGALAIAELAAYAARRETGEFPEDMLRRVSTDQAWLETVDKLAEAARCGWSVDQFAVSLGQRERVSGYVLHSVPVAVFAWWRHRGDFEAALSAALDCGGDTDTVGAMTGALAGVDSGQEGLPSAWVDGIAEWPRSIAWLRALAKAASSASEEGMACEVPPCSTPGLLARNLLFLLIVLVHGLRRLIPFPRV